MIIHTYVKQSNGMGLGDFIRGSLGTYQFCEKTRILFGIDCARHPIGKYLEIPVHYADDEHVIDLQNVRGYSIQSLHNSLVKQFNNIQTLRRWKSDVRIYTNIFPRQPVSQRATDCVRSHLIPTPELQKEIDKSLQFDSDYEVIHIRSGDLFAFNTQIGHTINYDLPQLLKKLDTISDIVLKTKKPLIVMSDSLQLRKIIAEKYGLFQTAGIPTHCALESEVKDTLVDFFILSKASHIHQYSVHPWGSGFSSAVNWLYDVPLTTHKM